MFCKTCGTLLIPKKTSYGKWMSCPNGHSQPEIQQQTPAQVSYNKPAERITVADGENFLAVHDHICEKCGYDKAELLEIMPFYSDEDNVIRMKCGKCGKVKQLDGKIM